MSPDMDPKGPGLVIHHLVVKYQQRNQKDESTDNLLSPMFYTGWNVKYSSNKYDIISLSNIFLRIS